MKLLLGRAFFWLSWPALYFYLKGTTRSRVMIESEGEILLVKGWHDGPKWALVGGGMHKNEEAIVSAIREVKEETGITLAPEQLIDLGSDRYDHRGLQYNIRRFGCKLDKKPPVHIQKLELVAYKWSAPEAITPELVEPNVVRQLAAFQQIR